MISESPGAEGIGHRFYLFEVTLTVSVGVEAVNVEPGRKS